MCTDGDSTGKTSLVDVFPSMQRMARWRKQRTNAFQERAARGDGVTESRHIPKD